jgi:hypothetical protein
VAPWKEALVPVSLLLGTASRLGGRLVSSHGPLMVGATRGGMTW